MINRRKWNEGPVPAAAFTRTVSSVHHYTLGGRSVPISEVDNRGSPRLNDTEMTTRSKCCSSSVGLLHLCSSCSFSLLNEFHAVQKIIVILFLCHLTSAIAAVQPENHSRLILANALFHRHHRHRHHHLLGTDCSVGPRYRFWTGY